MKIRRFDPADAPTICEIVYRSIHEVAAANTIELSLMHGRQVPEPDRWLQRLSEYETFVADDDAGKKVGWISMSGSGYVDMIFCLPEATRCEVAGALYPAVEHQAFMLGLSHLTAHASLLAQPVFKKRGWTIETTDIDQSLVEAGYGSPIHFSVRTVTAVHFHNGCLVAMLRGVHDGSAKRLYSNSPASRIIVLPSSAPWSPRLLHPAPRWHSTVDRVSETVVLATARKRLGF